MNTVLENERFLSADDAGGLASAYVGGCNDMKAGSVHSNVNEIGSKFPEARR